MSQPALYVRLLGEPEVESSAGRHAFLTDKRYLLLAFLACHRDWVDRARLARLFWPEHDPPAARHNLRQLIKRLHSLAWAPAVESGSGPDGARLRWLPTTDLADLDAALLAGRWSEAQELHRGPLLAGLRPDIAPTFDTWLENQRKSLESRIRREFMGQGAVLAGAGQHATAAELFGHLVAAEPYDEEALRAFMEASAVAGQPAKALTAFELFAVRVHEEFDLTPTAATEALAHRIRSGAGRVRLEALGANQAESGRTDYEVVGLGWLVGRELELSDVHRLLANPECRLLTITGPGGVGKSALARHAAYELGGKFADGYVYVALDGAPGASGLRSAVAAHFSPGSGADLDPAIAIGSRVMALVLDGLDEFQAETEYLLELLRRCPNLTILTTTRERLAVVGEWLLPIDGLSSPTAGATPSEVMANDAVRLFIAHAQRLRPAYYLGEEEARDVAHICRLVAGLPLALELAAAWTRALPAAAIAEEIAAGLDLLAGGPRGMSRRHASMRACIEHSWRSLSEGERRSWRALARFESPFDKVAAARVCGVALPQLAALVDKSVLRSSSSGQFSFHPLLRAFGVERLAEVPTERDAVKEVHAKYFLAVVDDAHEQASSTRRAAIDTLAASLDDVAAAWRWAVAALCGRAVASRPPTPAAVGRWCNALATICEGRAWYALASELFGEASLELDGTELYTELLGTLLAQRSWHELRLGRAGVAHTTSSRALELLSEHGASPAWRTALRTRAGIALQDGRIGEAETLYAQGLETLTGVRPTATNPELREIAVLTGALGLVKQLAGDRRGAVLQFQSQLELVREVGDTANAVTALSNLGNVLRLLNKSEEAQAVLEEGMRLAIEEHHDTIKPALNINLGVLHLQMGAADAARRHFEDAAKLAGEYGRRPLVVTAMFQLGRLELESGTVAAAKVHFERARDLAVANGNTSATLDALAGLAWVEWRAGTVSNARILGQAVHDHQATTPGTRNWVSELLAQLQEADGGADASAATESLGEGVTRALTLVAGPPR